MKYVSAVVLGVVLATYVGVPSTQAEEDKAGDEVARDRVARDQLLQIAGNTEVLFALRKDIQHLEQSLIKMHETLARSQGRLVDDTMIAEFMKGIQASEGDLGRRVQGREAAYAAFAKERDRILDER